MTTLTAADLSSLRRRIGDNTTPQDFTNDELDAIYTSTTLGNLNLDRTTFFALRERLGIAVNATAISNPSGGITRNQKYDQVMRLLKYWANVTGLDDDLEYDAITQGGYAAPSDDWAVPGNWSPQE